MGNPIRKRVEFTGQRSLSVLAGRPLRLPFKMQAAKLYAFQFANETQPPEAAK